MSSQGFRLNPLPINKTYGRHEGETIICVGSSGSIDLLDLSLVDEFPKISINRGLRATECRYCVFSDPDVYLAIRWNIKKQYGGRWPEMLIYNRVLNNWRSNGVNLQDKKYYELRLEYRDDWHNIAGNFNREPMEPDNPYKHYYQVDHLSGRKRNPKALRASGPAGMRLDGTFLRSHSTTTYAIEWAYRMLAGEKPGRILLVGIDFAYKGLRPRKGKDLTYTKLIDRKTQADKSCKLTHPDLTVPQLGRAVEDLRCKNIELINCSPWEGPLDEFIPRRDLSAAI